MRFTVAVVPILLACGPAVPRKVTPPADPHASREAMVRATFARLQAGDIDGLSALGDMESVFQQAFTCTKPPDFKIDKERHRSRIKTATDAAQGTEIEVLDIAAAQPHPPEVKKGQDVDGCVAKADLGEDKVDVKIRIKRKGQTPVESTSRVGLIQIGDRFYLERAPRVGGTPVLAEISRYADMACACKDAACSTKVQGEFEKWALDVMKSGVDLEDDPHVPDQMTKLTDCIAKLIPGNTPAPLPSPLRRRMR
jgi:hypothetical protein